MVGSGLPCEVEAALASCVGCHGHPPSGGASIGLATYDDLVRNTSAGTMIERALVRMQSTTAPMPPAPGQPVSASDIATLESWVAAGMPQGDCGAGSNPFDDPPQCTSGRTWTHGNQESPSMHPGVACIACHTAMGEGPRFAVAGTVYTSGHEPNDCYGATGGIVVEVTGANDRTFSLSVNSAGNFYLAANAGLTFPIRAKVITNGLERVMVAPQQSGDCNTCHSQNGTSMAPGRIALP
ncbi:MAG: hypothetical protein ABI867_12925 [Kofleriaceae bacterium]